ncbi:omega-6 fatty acid desaturase, chloroplastic isoform X1 [Dendrobium catenatum]|uniref:omega-6 fatty acid desaturase, chloroplastic isoform X1 n=1 Tax=Dendrobium catenatum TaxID=906689 RepID=UPI0009F6FEDB|nr:omega-6 fatty acid desaturase, chloroplastic isoform X1 [Dendrobium catenatum]XP_028554729.1 omega-6 fatty acid desaturase, chloroplastic isoform X1 [Dendrobium catenatum]XP_028554730.1 omega-6 fatty acid desaturase, chloroplastic isoform X1 [Dendrobium catenatum]
MACRLVDSTFHLPAPPKMAISSGRLNACQVHQRVRHQSIHFSSKKLIKVVRAYVIPISPSLQVNDIIRSDMCKTYGFIKIGEAVPDNVTLKDIITTLPKKVFEIDDVKAWRSVLVSFVSYALGIWMITKAPWYLLPLAWAWTGTAVTGFFVVGHDCAHRSFSRNKLVEDIVGTLAFLPLIYPYEPWRFKHDKHHAKTNMLLEDTAWHPILKEEIDASPSLRKAIIFGYGPLRPWMSIAHWLMWHFDLRKFKPNEVGRVKISLACVFAFIMIGWPLIIYKAGIAGWIKLWFMPWLVYHFWMSTFTMVHHTAPHIPFKASDEWNAAQAQLNGTVHCNYPRWIEILCHDINVHIPHHISPRIPSYNLREAHRSLQENWGKYLNEANWNWRLMKTIMTTCHVYNKERFYFPFDKIAPEEAQPVTFLRKFMPDYA